MSSSFEKLRRKRLIWRCRRGMKELDILFERFIPLGLDRLDTTMLAQFETFLDQPDQDILAALSGRDVPSLDAYQPVISFITEVLKGYHEPSPRTDGCGMGP